MLISIKCNKFLMMVSLFNNANILYITQLTFQSRNSLLYSISWKLFKLIIKQRQKGKTPGWFNTLQTIISCHFPHLLVNQKTLLVNRSIIYNTIATKLEPVSKDKRKKESVIFTDPITNALCTGKCTSKTAKYAEISLTTLDIMDALNTCLELRKIGSSSSTDVAKRIK